MNENFQKELEELKASLEGKTIEEIKEIEQKIIAEAEETQGDLQNRMFDLPKKGYKEAATYIQEFLDKQTVQWQYTVGLLTMYDGWDPAKFPGQISYPMLDGVLRYLGSLQFTGHEEWRKVIEINKYFEPLHKEYLEINTSIFENAEKHNVVLDKFNELTDGSVD